MSRPLPLLRHLPDRTDGSPCRGQSASGRPRPGGGGPAFLSRRYAGADPAGALQRAELRFGPRVNYADGSQRLGLVARRRLPVHPGAGGSAGPPPATIRTTLPMRAVVCTRYGSPDVLELRALEKPTPRPDEVRIRIRATAVTSSDCIVRGLNLPASMWIPARLALGIAKPRKSVLGMVLAGDIDAPGNAVTSFRGGEQVFAFDRFGFGAYADYKCTSGWRPGSDAIESELRGSRRDPVWRDAGAALPQEGRHPSRAAGAGVRSLRGGRDCRVAAR
jgi:hypothetical protein